MCPSFESRCKLIYITTFKGVEYTSKALHLVFYSLGGDILSENKTPTCVKTYLHISARHGIQAKKLLHLEFRHINRFSAPHVNQSY